MEEGHKGYYAIIPANVRYDTELTPNAKLLYGEITALCNEKGYCWANNSYFSELYKVSNVSISKWVSELESKGYIQRDIIYKEGTKEILNRYLRIVYDPIKEKFKDNNTLFNNTINNTYTYKTDFEKFYKLYPKKVAKENTRKWFEKHKPNTELMEAILTSLQKNIDYNEQWKKDNGQFIPQPITWLNQKRWEDEIEVKKSIGFDYRAYTEEKIKEERGYDYRTT